LFQRLQRGADGLDEVAEGVFEVVERADPTVGIDQQVRSASFSSPTRAPMSANVGSLGSSAPGEPGLAGVGTANAADVDAPPLRARKWVIVRMASPQPDKNLLAYTDFCNPSQSKHRSHRQ
jgi:hypothetical protein